MSEKKDSIMSIVAPKESAQLSPAKPQKRKAERKEDRKEERRGDRR